MTDPISTRRRFFPTPAWLIFGLLVVEGLLWLSERYRWFWINERKGWTVLIGVAVVGVAMLALLLWFIVALVFRWRFQFSIRSLLLLTVAVASPFSWLGMEMKAAREQKETVEAITHSRRLALVFYDYQRDEMNPLGGTAQPSTPAWLRRLLGDDFFRTLIAVLFPYSTLVDPIYATDYDLRNLDAFPELEGLSVFSPDVTNAGLEHLKRFTRLQELDLECTGITDAAMEHLGGLNQLQDLDLRGARVTDAGLERLNGLKQLRHLRIFDTVVTDAGVKKLQQALPNCRIDR